MDYLEHALLTGHVPGMDYLALEIDEVHVSVLHEKRGKQSKLRSGALRVGRDQTNTPAFEGVLLDCRHRLVTFNDGARAKRGEAGEQRAPLQRPRFMVDHRMASISAPGHRVFGKTGDCPAIPARRIK